MKYNIKDQGRDEPKNKEVSAGQQDANIHQPVSQVGPDQAEGIRT